MSSPGDSAAAMVSHDSSKMSASFFDWSSQSSLQTVSYSQWCCTVLGTHKLSWTMQSESIQIYLTSSSCATVMQS